MANFKLVDQDGWSVQSSRIYDDVCSHDRSSVLVQSKKITIMSVDTPTSTLASIARLAVLQGKPRLLLAARTFHARVACCV